MAHKKLIEYLLCLILLDKLCAIKIFQDLCECQQCWSLIASYITQQQYRKLADQDFETLKENIGKSYSPHCKNLAEESSAILTYAAWNLAELCDSCFGGMPA